MAVPSDPPTVAPSGWQTFAQNLADTVQDHDTRIADVEAGGGIEVLGSVDLASSASSITFSSIPATSTNLRLVLSATGTASTTNVNVLLRFNSDTGSNYQWQRHLANATTSSAQSTAASTFAEIGKIPAATAPSGSPGAVTLDIPDYAGTTFQKVVMSEGSYIFASGSSGMTRHSYGAFWLSTAAITEIVLLLPSGSFATGTKAVLYGLGG